MKLNLNCGEAILLHDSEAFLAQFDEININCGAMTVSSALNSVLAQKAGCINCGSTQVIQTPKNPVLKEGRVTIERADSFAETYLVCKGDCVITPEGARALDGMEGLLVLGKCFYPDTVKSKVAGAIRGKLKIAYPTGYEVRLGGLDLTEEAARRQKDGDRTFFSGRITVLSDEALTIAERKGLCYACGQLVAGEVLSERCRKIVRSEKTVIVPEGHGLVTSPDTLNSLYYAAGDKIFCLCGLRIQPKDREDCKKFTSIVVHGRAEVSECCMAAVQGVLQAKELKVFRGELLEVNGERHFSHEMLEVARQRGTQYTIRSNGALVLDDDVTADDLDAIAAIDFNGTLVAPRRLLLLVQDRCGEKNGTVSDRLEKHWEEAGQQEGRCINTGEYILL